MIQTKIIWIHSFQNILGHEFLNPEKDDEKLSMKSKENESDNQLKKDLQDAQKKIENLEKKSKYAEDQEYRSNYYKSEGTTLVLSLVLGLIGFQGTGHIYVGKMGKGIVILIGSFILFAAGASTIYFGVGIILLIIYFVIFIWQIFDSRKLCIYYNNFVKNSGKNPW